MLVVGSTFHSIPKWISILPKSLYQVRGGSFNLVSALDLYPCFLVPPNVGVTRYVKTYAMSAPFGGHSQWMAPISISGFSIHF